MPFLVLKTGPIFLFFLFFLFLKISFSLQKEEDFSKKEEKQKKKQTTFLALKTGPILLRNILGPVFNASLDQFLTLGFLFFFLVFFFFFFWLKPLFFIVFSAKNAKFEETQKRKKTLFVSTPVLTALVKMSFFVHFSFLVFFFTISNFFRDVF